MKSTLHTATSLLYLWVTIGVTVATHFCAGEPVSANLLDGAREDAACCCGDQDQMEGCCTTSITTIHLGNDHTFVAVGFSASIESEPIPALADLLHAPPSDTIPAVFVYPPGTGILTHILDCSLLI